MIGIVCGTRREAAVLAGLGRTQLVSIAISAAQPDRAEERARDLVQAGARILVSAGVAGGLDPHLSCGTLIIADEIIAQHQSWQLSEVKTNPLPGIVSSGGQASAIGAVIGVDDPVTDSVTKAELYVRTGALAVDMESHRVAKVAREARVPVMVLRTIADTAGRTVPISALAGIDSQGREVLWPVLARLLLRPWELSALLGLAQNFTIALKALENFVDGDPDLAAMLG